MTVAELIEILSKLPQDASVLVDADYGYHRCDGATLQNDGTVMVEIG